MGQRAARTGFAGSCVREREEFAPAGQLRGPFAAAVLPRPHNKNQAQPKGCAWFCLFTKRAAAPLPYCRVL